MARYVRARLTAGDGRRFGLTVGSAFVVLGAVLAWRGRPVGAAVAWAAGSLLLLAALAMPTRLHAIYHGWMKLGESLSKITTPIVLTAIYLLVFTPLGWTMRLLRRQPLGANPQRSSLWTTRSARDPHKSYLHRQF